VTCLKREAVSQSGMKPRCQAWLSRLEPRKNHICIQQLEAETEILADGRTISWNITCVCAPHLGVTGTQAQLLGFLKQCLKHLPCKINSICFVCDFTLKTKGINLRSHIPPPPLSLPPHTFNSLPREKSQKPILEKAFWA